MNPCFEPPQNTRFARLRATPAALLLGSFALTAHAYDTLSTAAGGQAVYDTTTNLTWIADAALAATQTFGVGGINGAGYMSEATAVQWIAAMNAADYLGASNWQVPTTIEPDPTCSFQAGGISFGTGCTGSPLGELFYNGLGGAANASITNTHNANYALFSNLPAGEFWSTPFQGSNIEGWYFNMSSGWLDANYSSSTLSVLAVRAGPLAPVPEPSVQALILAGLAAMGALAHVQRRDAGAC